MTLEIPRGKYVLAVSGGVDSMVLLDMLAKRPDLALVVAHFNHNIREDSQKDQELVQDVTNEHKLPFDLGTGQLGTNASEETARNARYTFLKQAQARHHAKAIITAHHQDDVIETAFINVIRGTDRRGLSAIVNNKEIIRPLRKVPKKQILEYAKSNKLTWREDSTNQDVDYLRNYLRLNVLTKLTPVQKRKLISNLDKVAKINYRIDKKIATISQTMDKSDIDRSVFAALPNQLGNELVAQYLRETSVVDFDSNTIERLSMAIKTSKPNSMHPVKQSVVLKVGKSKAKLVTP
ncbi:tRNA lysidine(34) synthetase TilS [Candidatus Saccharibacteria bacterium]|nr:tRNA lysidine(34) synthetase TilS [Candidatus Saccharibacteria bacterium]